MHCNCGYHPVAVCQYKATLLEVRVPWHARWLSWGPHYLRNIQVSFFFFRSFLVITFLKSVAIFATTPPEAAGVVAAIFNSSLQVGCAAGIAIVTSIQTSIQVTHGGPLSFVGRADGFWFLFAALCALTVALLVFMKDTIPALGQLPPQNDKDRPSAEQVIGGSVDKEDTGVAQGEL